MNTTNGVPLRIRIEYMDDMPNNGIQVFPDECGKYMYYSDVQKIIDRITFEANAESASDAELIKHLNASLAEAQAERDRLREALKEIESVCSGQTRGIVVHIDRIASAALAEALGE